MFRVALLLLALVFSSRSATAALKGSMYMQSSFPGDPSVPQVMIWDLEDGDQTGRLASSAAYFGVTSFGTEHVQAASNRIEIVQHTYVRGFGIFWPQRTGSGPIFVANSASEIASDLLIKQSDSIPTGVRLKGRLAFYIEGEVYRESSDTPLIPDDWSSLVAEIPGQPRFEKKLAEKDSTHLLRISEPLLSGFLSITAGVPFQVSAKLLAQINIFRVSSSLRVNGTMVLRGIQDIQDETGTPIAVSPGQLVVLHPAKPGALDINPAAPYTKIPPMLNRSILPPYDYLEISWPARYVGYYLETTTNLSGPWTRYVDSATDIRYNDDMSVLFSRKGGLGFYRLRKEEAGAQ